MTTMGKYRHLSRCAMPEGTFCMLAIDHRSNLLTSLNKYAPQPLTDAEFTDFKQQVIAALLPDASALLADPGYGFGAGIASRMIAARGLLSPIEVTNYDQHPSQREIEFIPGWSVEKIKRVGADGVKLLLPYHPQAANAAHKHTLVQQIVAECTQNDIPFFLEPIAYSLDPAKKLSNAELREVVLESARVFSAMGVDVLKVEFPVDAKQSMDQDEWQDACEALNAACTVPWALLSAGVEYATFAVQARIACEAGACGVIVGRAVWTEAVELQGAARQAFLQGEARRRMNELYEIAAKYGAPWHDRVAAPAHDLNWYQGYGESNG
jgi:tagatose-1,6-bisphosphate aldolase